MRGPKYSSSCDAATAYTTQSVANVVLDILNTVDIGYGDIGYSHSYVGYSDNINPSCVSLSR